MEMESEEVVEEEGERRNVFLWWAAVGGVFSRAPVLPGSPQKGTESKLREAPSGGEKRELALYTLAMAGGADAEHHYFNK